MMNEAQDVLIDPLLDGPPDEPPPVPVPVPVPVEPTVSSIQLEATSDEEKQEAEADAALHEPPAAEAPKLPDPSPPLDLLPSSSGAPATSAQQAAPEQPAGAESASAPAPSAAITATSSLIIAAAEPVHDVVLGTAPASGPGGGSSSGQSTLSVPRDMGAASLASTVEVIGATRSIDELEALLQSDCVRSVSGAHSEAVSRCVQYVRGLAREGERVLCGWPVLSINEWGHQQVRTLVLTSHALYRIAFAIDRGAIDHYSRTSLGSCRLIERGRYAFKLLLTEPDGRENPFTYFWSAYVKKGSKDKRYEKVYYPIHPDSVPVELVLAMIISSLQVANHILHDQIRSYCYVTRLEVVDFVPNPNAVDDLMDTIVPSLQRMGDKFSEAIRAVVAQPSSRRQRQ